MPAPLIGSETQDVIDYKISPDSQSIVYYLQGEFTGEVEGEFVAFSERGLYSVPITGGSPNLFAPFANTPSDSFDGATLCFTIEEDYAISSDSAYVAFAAFVGEGGSCRLFRASLNDGSDTVELTEGTDHDIDSFRLAADGRNIVYLAEEVPEGGPFSPGENIYAIFSDGGTPRNLSALLLPGRNALAPSFFSNVQLDATGDNVALLAQESEDGKAELYNVQLSSNTITQISGPSAGDNNDYGINFDFRSGQEGQLLYVAEQGQEGVRELFLGAPNQLIAPTPTPSATPTNTSIPPTATPTNTSIPPTATSTSTPVPPTSTPVPTSTVAPTNTPIATPLAEPTSTPASRALFLPLIENQ